MYMNEYVELIFVSLKPNTDEPFCVSAISLPWTVKPLPVHQNLNIERGK